MQETPPTTETAVVDKYADIDKGNYVLKFKRFKGKEGQEAVLEGLGFWTIEFKNIDAIKKHFNDDDVIVKMVNGKMASGLRAQANNEANPYRETAEERAEIKEAIQERLDTGNIEIITQEEAEKYVPGTRDVVSLSGIQKRIADKLKIASELKKKGEDNSKVRAEIKELQEQFTQLIAEGIDQEAA